MQPIHVSEDEELDRVLGEVAEALGARGAMLTMHPDDGTPAFLVRLHDPELDESAALLLNDFAPSDDERLVGGLHAWRDLDHASGVKWLLRIPVQRVPGHQRLAITAFFDQAGAAVQARAEATYVRRRPFAVGYFRLWQRERLEARISRSFRQVLELMHTAVMIVADQSELLYANGAAQALLDGGDGLRLWRGRMQPTRFSESSRFDTLLSRALAPAGAHERRAMPLLRFTRRDGRPLIVSVHPGLESAGAEQAAAIVLIVDPDVDAGRFVQPVGQLFDLSLTEMRLVTALVGGATISEAAEQMRVTVASARTYLKQVFSKTQTNRQADLIRLLLMTAVRAGAEGAYAGAHGYSRFTRTSPTANQAWPLQ